MNVLFIMSNFPRWEGDVHSPWAVELIHRLQQRGAHVAVCAPAHRGLGDHVYEGIPVYRFRYAPARWETLTHESGAPNKIRRQPLYLGLLPGYLLAGAARVRRLCRTAPWDVVHVHWPIPQGLLILWGCPASRRPRLISTFYGADLALVRAFPALLRPLLRSVVRASDAVTAISRYTGELLAQLAGTDPVVIPYGEDLARRPHPEGTAEWKGEGGESFRILTVGRLIPRKGQAVLLRAAAELRRRHPHIRVDIIGEGQERPRLEALIQELHLEGCAILHGRVSDEALERAYAACDVFVLPAVVDAAGDTEGLGMVLLEAMRYEKPVVASAAGGIPDIVQHGQTGYLVPPGDPEALRDALAYVIEHRDEARALGERARAVNARRFAWEGIVDAYWSLYQGETHA